MAVINGEYVVKTPIIEDAESTPNKRVTWRESLEEAFYDDDDDEDECVIVDVGQSQPEQPTTPKRRQFVRQISVEDSQTPTVVKRPLSGGKSHSAPSSPVKSPLHSGSGFSPQTLRRSRSADRNSLSGRGNLMHVPHSRGTGHTHVYGELQNKVRRVRCRHTSTNEENFNFIHQHFSPIIQYLRFEKRTNIICYLHICKKLKLIS